MRPAIRICPVSLVSQSSSSRSSSTPSTHMAAAPAITAHGMLVEYTGAMYGIREPISKVMSRPTVMAMPPSRGIGVT